MVDTNPRTLGYTLEENEPDNQIDRFRQTKAYHFPNSSCRYLKWRILHIVLDETKKQVKLLQPNDARSFCCSQAFFTSDLCVKTEVQNQHRQLWCYKYKYLEVAKSTLATGFGSKFILNASFLGCNDDAC